MSVLNENGIVTVQNGMVTVLNESGIFTFPANPVLVPEVRPVLPTPFLPFPPVIYGSLNYFLSSKHKFKYCLCSGAFTTAFTTAYYRSKRVK